MSINSIIWTCTKISGQSNAVIHTTQGSFVYFRITSFRHPALSTASSKSLRKMTADKATRPEYRCLHCRQPNKIRGFPACTEYAATSLRTIEPAPITQPRRRMAPSSTTQLAPIHTSSSITIPPLLGRKPCSRMGVSRRRYSWFTGAKVQFAAIATPCPMRIPFPVYRTQPELITESVPTTSSPIPPAGLIFTNESITERAPIIIFVPRTESSMSARLETLASGCIRIISPPAAPGPAWLEP